MDSEESAGRRGKRERAHPQPAKGYGRGPSEVPVSPKRRPALEEGGEALPEGSRGGAPPSSLIELSAQGERRVAEAVDGLTGRPVAITRLAADSEGFAFTTESGELVLLDGEFTETGRTLLQGALRLALAEEAVIVGTETGTREYLRAGLLDRYESGLKGGLAAAAEKLAISGGEGLALLDRYDGKTIWNESGARLDLAIAGEKVYSLFEDGSVAAYNGPDNLYPPETRFVLDPALPDGENGYYVTRPWLSLEASDLESYVSETLLAVGEVEPSAYEGALELPEGEYPIRAYSTDST